MNVLHVEDFAIEAHLVRHSLSWRAPHIHVHTASSVAEALARLDAFERALATRANTLPSPDSIDDVAALGGLPHYDVVLADLQLPDGSGLDVLRHVREHKLPLAVVMLTGSGDEESVFETLHAGADDYIAKEGEYLTNLPRTLQLALTHFRADSTRAGRTLRVLYAEPNAADAESTVRALARSAPHMSFEVVSRPDDVLARFGQPQAAALPDLLLLDHRPPGLTALDVVKELHARGLDLPVVLVTGHGTAGIARLAVKLGVSDYLIKSPDYLERLPAALEAAFHRAAIAREQQALRKREREFQSLADNLPDAMLRFGRQGRIEYANPMAEQALGGEATLIGRALTEVGLSEPAVQALDAALRGAFARGAQMQLALTLQAHEFRGLPLADPTALATAERHTDWRLVPERGANGQVTTVLALARDVTDARHAEAKARESERQTRATVDALSAQVAILDEQGTIMAVNQAWRDFAAGNSDDPERVLASTNYLEICAAAEGPEAEEARAVAAGMRAVISGERENFSMTYPCHAPDERRWYCVRITRFAGIGPVRVVVAHENVSDRMLAQSALDEHRLKLEALVRVRSRELEAANEQLRRSDERLLAMAELSQRAHELDEAALLQAGLQLALRATGSEAGWLQLAGDAPGEPPLRVVWPLASKAEAERPGGLSVGVREGPQLRLQMAVSARPADGHRASFDDVDRQALQLMADDLWRLVMRHRAGVALRRARDEALAAQRAKSSFLAHVSDEIRAPMSTLVGMAEALRLDPHAAPVAERLGQIERASHELLGTIDGVLDLAMAESGHLLLQAHALSVAQLVARVCERHAGPAASKGLSLMIDIDPALQQPLIGDGKRLEQVLAQCLGHALNLSERGTIAVRARLAHDDRALRGSPARTGAGEDAAEMVTLRIEVQVERIDLVAEQQALLLQPAEHAKEAAPGRHAGTASGLVLARRLATLMGGNAGVLSAPSAGITFWMTARLRAGHVD